jgi:hypothetical protein
MTQRREGERERERRDPRPLKTVWRYTEASYLLSLSDPRPLKTVWRYTEASYLLSLSSTGPPTPLFPPSLPSSLPPSLTQAAGHK